MTALMPIYPNRLPISFTRGDGVWLFDEKNTAYLDALSGIAVCGLGHAHPAVTKTLCDQAAKLLHTSNTYHVPEQVPLADTLARLSGMDEVFYANSGAEANEAALKLARLYAHQRGIDRPLLITMEKSFHGRTMGTLSASGSARLQQGFEPLLEGFVHIPFNDLSALKRVIATQSDRIIGIVLEPIQGDGGIREVNADFFEAIRYYCDEHDWLLIADEIQTGLGRTGAWFAYQHYGILPDIVTVAKTLGNGFPIGAYLTRGKANGLFTVGKHGSTFAGSPLGCAVALTVLETLEKQSLVAHAQQMGTQLMQTLQEKLGQHPRVVALRGKGLMIGIELDRPCRELPKIGLQHRLLFNVVSDRTIRLLPALILQEEHLDLIVSRLTAAINELE